mmetsp:Transcript_11191/g.31564  ORF Transcript_11191/g.31564 Transcript_11191/m.31564 type:complete len:350 (-) Transcript_11191:1818-2867(-)
MAPLQVGNECQAVVIVEATVALLVTRELDNAIDEGIVLLGLVGIPVRVGLAEYLKILLILLYIGLVSLLRCLGLFLKVGLIDAGQILPLCRHELLEFSDGHSRILPLESLALFGGVDHVGTHRLLRLGGNAGVCVLHVNVTVLLLVLDMDVVLDGNGESLLGLALPTTAIESPCHHVARLAVLEIVIGEGPVAVWNVAVVVKIESAHLDTRRFLEPRGTNETGQTVAIGCNEFRYLNAEHIGDHLGRVVLLGGVPERRVGFVLALEFLSSKSIADGVGLALVGRYKHLGALLEPASGRNIIIEFLVEEDDVPDIRRKRLGNLFDPLPLLLHHVFVNGAGEDAGGRFHQT